MLIATPPMAITPDHVWVFFTAERTQGVEASRIAYAPDSDEFVALPVEVFNTEGTFPTFREDGLYVMGFRWATSTDIDTHPEYFAQA